jgi:glycyl-tRNA synthetase beta chain
MTDFLLELRSEEIPARMQDDARQNLARLFAAEIAKAGLKADDIATYATPRRLALIAYGLPLETLAVSEEIKGPKTSAPPQALEGFLRKTGLIQEQLVDRDGVYFAVIEKPGRATSKVLADAIPAIIRAFPWPKSMRWGDASQSTESLRWVRPLQGVVALLGDDVVECEVDGIVSGAATMGHRFHHSGAVTIGNAADYGTKLRACHVIVDQNERENIIREGAQKVAADAGLILVQDPGLVTENAGLTEWPVPMLGRFDPAFLAVPEEVIQLTARVNQKYFVCQIPPPAGEVARSDGGAASEASGGATLAALAPLRPVGAPPRHGEELGKLTNAFVCTANIVAKDGGAAIVAGNEKVLAARLSDAKFFWEADLKVPLDEQAAKLSNIVFHEKLGTVADKVERVAKLARWLVESGVVAGAVAEEKGTVAVVSGTVLGTSGGVASGGGETVPETTATVLADQAERAARLCKADLVTGMVGEFPELQGIMGGYYARAQGESDAVADAIRDHYKPVGQGDDVPTAPVTVAVSLADKLDTLVGFFALNELPTGSKDPFALRRAALAVISIVTKNQLALSLSNAMRNAAENLLPLAKERRLHFDDVLMAALAKEAKRNGDIYEGWQGEPWKFIEVIFLKGDVYHRNLMMQSWPIICAWSQQSVEGFINSSGSQLLDFFADRLKVQQREAGVRHDLIDAVFALGGEDDLVRLLARVKALQGFVGTEDGVNLLAGYKRAANILKSSPHGGGGGEADGGAATAGSGGATLASLAPLRPVGAPPPVGEELVEAALREALSTAEPLAAAAIEREDFEAAMTALASLRSAVDAFFEGVMVNDPDPNKRAYRLGLLARFRDAVHRVADFSKIEG